MTLTTTPSQELGLARLAARDGFADMYITR